MSFEAGPRTPRRTGRRGRRRGQDQGSGGAEYGGERRCYEPRVFLRLAPPEDTVTLRFEGKKVVASPGEPLAVALLAAGIERFSRSPKLHRPRGPACLRGDCEGCIARVDGVPNVMTCMRPARGGEEIAVQNVLGSSDTDLLRITDWFFPKEIDHHHLLARIPGVSD